MGGVWNFQVQHFRVFYDRMFQSKISKISPAYEIIVLIPFKCKKLAFTFMTTCSTIWDNLYAKIISFLGIGAFKNMIYDSISMIHSRMNFRFYHWLNAINREYITQPQLELQGLKADRSWKLKLFKTQSKKIVIVDC